MPPQPSNKLSERIVPFPHSEEAESLLAFSFDENGEVKIVAEFTSERDKLALLQIASSFVAELSGQIARAKIHAAIVAQAA